jgi:hypothetical protein
MLDTPKPGLEFLRLAGGDSVGINPDAGNACIGPRPLPGRRTAFRLLAPAPNNRHVKDDRAFEAAPWATPGRRG